MLPVDGATGYIDTNYAGKADALIRGLADCNFIFLHVEAPDESGHEGNLEHKIKAIEDFDEKVVGTVLAAMDRFEDLTVMVLPDHPTPISKRTHTSDPVPFAVYRKQGFPPQQKKAGAFTEKEAAKTGLFIARGHTLIDFMINGKM